MTETIRVPKVIDAYRTLVFGVLIIALAGTVTNFVYASAALTPLALTSAVILLYDSVPKAIVWLLSYLGVSALGAFFYAPESLISFEFYRRDGNIFISYAPLIALAVLRMKLDVDRLSVVYLRYVAAVYGVLLVAYFSSVGMAVLTDELASFPGLFVARNATGGFIAITSALAFAVFWERRNVLNVVTLILLILALVTTYSRGSILGLGIGIVSWLLLEKRLGWVVFLMIAAFACGTVFIGTLNLDGYSAFEGALSDLTAGVESVKEANVAIRFAYLWPKAIDMFLHSPIFGTGFGSFDDIPFVPRELGPLMAYNGQHVKVFSDSHAHHSYLHILAEQGLLGFGLFLGFWIALFLYLRKSSAFPITQRFLLIAFLTLSIESFTEHRISTPSNVLPFSLILGLYMAASHGSYRRDRPKPA